MAYIDYDHRDHFSVIHARFDDAAANDAWSDGSANQSVIRSHSKVISGFLFFIWDT
jgi:hypothetical protein